MKKLLFIYNPHAGKEAIKSKLSDVVEIFMDAQYEVTIYATKKAKDATGIVSSKGSNYDLIVCSGGDGTLNEVTDGLMELEKRPVCGYIPAGTVNDFATTLRIPKNIVTAANNVVTGEKFPCDIGSLNGDYYNYVAAFGAFTEVAYETPQGIKNIFGRMAYFLDGVKRLPTLKSYKVHVKAYNHVNTENAKNAPEDTYDITEDIIFGMISNSESVGGFKGITGPNVKLDDGLFEVILIKRPENPLELQMIINALLTQEANEKVIRYFRAGHITLTCEEEMSWTLDGEYGGTFKEAEIINHKQAITYIRG